MHLPRTLSIALVLGATACGSTDPGESTSPETNRNGDETVAGVNLTEEGAIFKTAEYTLGPGEEKYLCYAASFDESFVAEAVSHEARSSLHHIIFSKTSAPEPEGFSECDTLFRLTWEPVYLTGAGASSLELPEGFGHEIAAGTQMVAQLHLLNASSDPVTESVEIALRRSAAEAPKPVAGYAFGTMDVRLPPAQPSSLEAMCDVREPVRLLAAFPHMHLLGTRMTFQVSRAGGEFQQVFDRNPYDFDDQHLETFDFTLDVGDRTRVRCEYDNPHDQEITFGESTMNEMCFFVAFAADRSRISGCMSRPEAPTTGTSGTTPGTSG